MAGNAPRPAGRAAVRLLDACGRVVQLHPYSWKLAWEAVHRLPALLPHDKTYIALKHFVAAVPEGLFLDVGANDGISALSFRKFSRTYRILSLEPNRLLEPALKRIKSGDARFDYRMLGAGSAPARLRFFMPVYKGIQLHTFTSVNRDQVEHAIKENFGARVARRTTIETIESEVVRLDDLDLSPAIVKIDAEGVDYDILTGLTDTIARSRPFVMIEVAWTEQGRIGEFLRAHDYELTAYDIDADNFTTDIGRRGAQLNRQRNFFAIPRERMHALPISR